MRGVASRFSIVRTIDFMRFELASMDRCKHAIGRAGALAQLIAPAARHRVMVKAAILQEPAHCEPVTDETPMRASNYQRPLDQIKQGWKDVIEVARPGDKLLDRMGQFALVGERPLRCIDIPQIIDSPVFAATQFG